MSQLRMPDPHLAEEYPRNRLGPLEPESPAPSIPEPSRSRLRRWVFRAWVAGSAMVAVFVGLLGPLTSAEGEIDPFVGVVLPALMVFLLATGLGWLVVFGSGPSDKGG